MTNNGKLIEYIGPSERYLIRVRDGQNFVTVATRSTLEQVRSYARRLLRQDIPVEDIRFYQSVRWAPRTSQ